MTRYRVFIQRKTIDATKYIHGAEPAMPDPEAWIFVGDVFDDTASANDWARNRYPKGSWRVEPFETV